MSPNTHTNLRKHVIENMGNSVKIDERIIPAVFIQGEAPQVIDGTPYDIYFEIMFESGEHWVVMKNNHRLGPDVYMYFKFDLYPDDPADCFVACASWEKFLDYYTEAGEMRTAAYRTYE